MRGSSSMARSISALAFEHILFGGIDFGQLNMGPGGVGLQLYGARRSPLGFTGDVTHQIGLLHQSRCQNHLRLDIGRLLIGRAPSLHNGIIYLTLLQKRLSQYHARIDIAGIFFQLLATERSASSGRPLPSANLALPQRAAWNLLHAGLASIGHAIHCLSPFVLPPLQRMQYRDRHAR